MKKDNEPVVIGRILGAHGVRGNLRLLPLTDYPERFASMKSLTVRMPGKPDRVLEVEHISFQDGKNQYLVRAAGIEDCDAADCLKGAFVVIPPDERVPLGTDEYWHEDLVGMDVLDIDTGSSLGVLEEVMVTGSNDVYSVRTPEGRLVMLPAIRDVIRSVDVAAKVMKVHLLEGLVD